MGINFRGKSEKAPKINFRGFKFRGSNQFRGVAPAGTSDDYYYSCTTFYSVHGYHLISGNMNTGHDKVREFIREVLDP